MSLLKLLTPNVNVEEIRLNIHNIDKVARLRPRSYGWIRMDSNANCNVRCVYCHFPRSSEVIPLDVLERFFNERVVGVEYMQVGCEMEPTMDPRMCDIFRLIARSKARPTKWFRLQTNGLLLHRHDPAVLVESGLTHLYVSIDSADEETHKSLRGGSSLKRVDANIRQFHEAYPEVVVHVTTVVTTLNVNGLADLVRFGLDVGASSFAFRQVFYQPDSTIVDHSRMPSLVVLPADFARVKQDLTEQFGAQARLFFFDDDGLLDRERRIKTASLY